jgi:hypothetical protein
MSGRKNTLSPFKTITSGDMSGNLTSKVTDISHMDNVSIQLNWTGTPTGTFAVQGSLDQANWVSLALSPTPGAAGAAGNILLDLNQLSFPYIRTIYTASSGSGSLDAIISGKMVWPVGYIRYPSTGGAGGNVVGPASATDLAIAIYDGATGLLLKNSLVTIDSAGKISAPNILISGQTASRVPYLDASKNIVSSSVTPTELGYLSGVTSAIQTQLGTKEATANKGAANGYASLDASGLVPVTQIPPAALERLVVVANQAARFALTTATVQNGDTVKQTDTATMYFVIDDTNLGNSAGYAIYTAGTAASVAWSGITGIPAPVVSLSGTNTGDQTITLTGDATGSGTGSFAVTISSNVVTNAKLAQMANNTIKGNTSGGTANASDLALGDLTVPSILSVSGGTKSVIGSGAAISLANQSANLVLSGPSSGSAATPTFRSLVNADIPGLTIQSKSANYTVLSTDRFMIGDATSAAFTFTLPTGQTGVPLFFKKKDSDATFNAITITDGTFSTTINTAGESVLIAYNGSAYEIMDRRIPSATVVDSNFTASAGFGTVTSKTITRTRLGDRLKIVGSFTNGTVAGSTAYVQLATGLAIDYTKTTTGQQRIGTYASGASSTVTLSGTSWEGAVFTDGSTSNQLFFAQFTGTSGLVKGFGSDVGATTKLFTFECDIPISGWNGWSVLDKVDLLASQISELRQDIRELIQALREECTAKSDKAEERVEGLRRDLSQLEKNVEVNKVHIGALSTLAGIVGGFAQAHVKAILGR